MAREHVFKSLKLFFFSEVVDIDVLFRSKFTLSAHDAAYWQYVKPSVSARILFTFDWKKSA